MRPPTLHVFASVKGGVGKSTLAVTCARLLAARGRPCVVLDMDFTGTSLADGLDLCAPAVDGNPGVRIDQGGPPEGRLLSVDETRRRRDRRRDDDREGVQRYLPYLNDLMTLFDPIAPDYPIDWFLWRSEPDDGVLYMPSSPLRVDVSVARNWLHYEEKGAYIQHVAWMIDRLLRLHTEVRDVVIDLPPGTTGFSRDIFALASTLDLRKPAVEGYPDWSGTAWGVRAFLVTSEDRNDYRPALDYLAQIAGTLPSLVVLFNRADQSMERLRALVKEHFRDAGDFGFETKARRLPNDPYALGRIFREPGVRDLQGATGREVEEALALEGAK